MIVPQNVLLLLKFRKRIVFWAILRGDIPEVIPSPLDHVGVIGKGGISKEKVFGSHSIFYGSGSRELGWRRILRLNFAELQKG